MDNELYHASENQDIEILEPKAVGQRDPNDEARIYATEDEAYATMFLVKSDDSWTIKFGLRDPNLNAQWFICISDKDRYLEKDKGGVVYTLPKEQFIPVPECRTPEWMSHSKVRPIAKKIYNSGLEAMLEHNVQIYWGKVEDLEELNKAKTFQDKLKVLQLLDNENEKQGYTNAIKQYREKTNF